MLQTTAERLELEREVATAAQSSMARAEEALRAAEAQVRTPPRVSGHGGCLVVHVEGMEHESQRRALSEIWSAANRPGEQSWSKPVRPPLG
jgi:hypothetical protein